jgi:hypothetical protein
VLEHEAHALRERRMIRRNRLKTAVRDTSIVLTQLREAQVVGIDEIRDRSRGVLDFTGWRTVEDAVRRAAETIMLDWWDGPWPLLVVESDSLAGVLETVAAEYRLTDPSGATLTNPGPETLSDRLFQESSAQRSRMWPL